MQELSRGVTMPNLARLVMKNSSHWYRCCGAREVREQQRESFFCSLQLHFFIHHLRIFLAFMPQAILQNPWLFFSYLQ